MKEQQENWNWNEEELTEEELEQERQRQEKFSQRIQQMKKEKERCILIQNCIKIGVPIAAVLVIAMVAVAVGMKGVMDDSSQEKENTVQVAEGSLQYGEDDGSNANEQNNTNTQDNVDISEQNNVNGVNNTSIQNNSNTQNGLNVQNHANTQNQLNEQVISSGQWNSGNVNMDNTQQTIYSATTTGTTLNLSSEIISTNALLIDLDSGNILAQRDMKTVLSPASMTKVLTVLVAAEQIQESQLDDTFTMTLEITDYAYVNDCSSVGFLDGEVVTVRDLFYGTILPSGGDAAVGLATYVAGSHEAFVELMNDKLEELGLSKTAHVTNCVGLYDKEHHCTVYDMAMIMEAAMENELCREIMNAHTYTTAPTTEHPEGITISNWFLRRIEDKDTGGEVLCAKTGYVAQSGSCAVSYAKDHSGKEYICVTANATSSWKCIYDHVALYKMFAIEPKEESCEE